MSRNGFRPAWGKVVGVDAVADARLEEGGETAIAGGQVGGLGVDALGDFDPHLSCGLRRGDFDKVAVSDAHFFGPVGVDPQPLEVAPFGDGEEVGVADAGGVGQEALLAVDEDEAVFVGLGVRRFPLGHRLVTMVGEGLTVHLDFLRFSVEPERLGGRGFDLDGAFGSEVLQGHAERLDHGGGGVFAGEVEVFSQPHVAGEFGDDLGQRLCLGVDDIDGGGAHGYGRADDGRQVLALGRAALGQHVVGAHGRLRPFDVADDEEVEGFVALCEQFGLGSVAGDVDAVEEAGFGFALERALGHHVDDALIGLAEGEFALDADAVAAFCFGFGRGRVLLGVERAQFGRVAEFHAAGFAVVAEEGVDAGDHAEHLGAVGVVAAVGGFVALLDTAGGPVLAQAAGDGVDGGCGDIGDGGRPLRGVVLHAFLELVEADAPFVDKLLVVEVFGDEDVGYGQQEGKVCAGPDRHPFGGEEAGVAVAGVDDDDVGAFSVGSLHAGRRGGRKTFDVVAAEEDYIFGVAEVGGRHAAGRPFVGDIAAGAAHGVVGLDGARADGRHQARPVESVCRPWVVGEKDLVRSVLLEHFFELGSDLAVRLLPGDRHEVVFADALHGMGDAVFVVRLGDAGMAAGAQLALALAMILLAGNLPDSAILDVHPHAACRGTGLAEGRNLGNRSGTGLFHPFAE